MAPGRLVDCKRSLPHLSPLPSPLPLSFPVSYACACSPSRRLYSLKHAPACDRERASPSDSALYATTTFTLALVTGELLASSLLSRRSMESKVLPDSVNLNGIICTSRFSVCLSLCGATTPSSHARQKEAVLHPAGMETAIVKGDNFISQGHQPASC